MISAPAGLIIIQTDRRQPVISGAIQPHIGLGLCRFPFLLQYLAGCFICMDDVPLQQMPVKLFIHRLHIIYAAFDDPVSQCRSGEFHSQLFPIRLLAVKRNAVHIFLVHHISNRGRRYEAALQQRTWCFSPNDNGNIDFSVFRSAKHFLDILNPFYFCRDDPQFFTDNLFPDDFHRSITLGAVSKEKELFITQGYYNSCKNITHTVLSI